MEEELLNPTVEEETVENAEKETAEETNTSKEVETQKGRYYTDEEFNARVNEAADRRYSRKLRKLAKEQALYKDTENVLKAGLGVNNLSEANESLRKYYEEEGIKMPSKVEPEMSDREIQALADADAEDFIDDGEEAMTNEANRLAEIGYENLSKREKLVFKKLADTLTNSKNKKELLSIGATEDVIDSDSFKEFAKKFNPKTPVSEIYELYSSIHETKEEPVSNPGSMKNNELVDEREYFTDEEIDKMTDDELEKNWDKVRKSMTRQ